MGKTRIFAGACATALLAGGLTVATAPAASAVDIDITVTCSETYTAENQVIYAQPGDRIRINYGDISGLCASVRTVFATTSEFYENVFESGFPNGRGDATDTPGTYVWEIRSDVSGVFGGPDPDDPDDRDWVINVDSGGSFGQDFYLIIGTAAAGSSQGAGGPAMWHQSYARASQGEECEAGWSPSWDFWPNGGKGGWVCNRTVPATGSTP
jgi:hypothetical protein